MPIYEYRCACGKAFEELVLRRSDEASVRCPICGGDKIARLLSRPAAARMGDAGGACASPPPRCGPVG